MVDLLEVTANFSMFLSDSRVSEMLDSYKTYWLSDWSKKLPISVQVDQWMFSKRGLFRIYEDGNLVPWDELGLATKLDFIETIHEKLKKKVQEELEVFQRRIERVLLAHGYSKEAPCPENPK